MPSNQRVLICSAQPHILRLVEVNLERQGYDVEKAATGAEAFGKLMETTFGLAVIDAELPDMTGAALADKVRTDPDTAHVRVMVLGSDPPA